MEAYRRAEGAQITKQDLVTIGNGYWKRRVAADSEFFIEVRMRVVQGYCTRGHCVGWRTAAGFGGPYRVRQTLLMDLLKIPPNP